MEEQEKSILVCLSPAPSNRAIIHAAAGMRHDEDELLVALYVETPENSHLTRQDQERLQKNMEYARQSGARIEVVSGADVAFQISEYLRLTGIRRVVMGQSINSDSRLFPKTDISDQLLGYLPGIELHVIPDGARKARYHFRPDEDTSLRRITLDTLICVAVLALATLLGALFDRLGFTNSNIIMTYLLGVLIISIVTSHRAHSLVSAVAAVLLFNYFFVQPRFSLQAFETGYPITFIVMFLTSFVTGTLAIRLKSAAKQASRTAYQTKIISDTDQMLAKAKSREEILSVCSRQIEKLLEQSFALLEPESGLPEEQEGKTYFPIQARDQTYAILEIDTGTKTLEVSEQSILLSILGECALALENEKNVREKEEAALQIENERLRSTLLRAISHDLRTPLTSITGNASSLISRGSSFDEETRQALYSAIYEDSLWLNNMVENLLASTRLEQGQAQLNFSTEIAEDLIEEAAAHVRSISRNHRIITEPETEILPVRADARLIIQVLVNLLDNAVKYTPDESEIRISAQREGDFVRISVADNGPGVSDEDKEKVFEMFYTGSSGVADGRRSLGFGLALCRTIVEAHGGTISVTDNEPNGAVFSFTLVSEEVNMDG